MRWIAGMGVALLAASPAGAIDRAISGLWYNSTQSGHGFELTVIGPSTATVTWYTYDANGTPIWVAGVLNESTPNVLTGSVSLYQGMRFGQFAPASNQGFTWGTLRFAFNGCHAATVEYDGTLTLVNGTGFGAGTLPLTKLAGVAGLTCGAPSGSGASVAGVYTGGVRSNATGTTDFAAALLEPNGTATITIPGEGGYFGTYTSDGSSLSFSLTGITEPGLVFPNGATTSAVSGTATARAGDFVTGSYSGSSDSGGFTLTYAGLSTRPPSIASIAGNYRDPTGQSDMTFTISGNGALSGRDAEGCLFAGTVSPISGVNAYNVGVTLSNCGAANGTFTGKAVASDWDVYGDGRGLTVAVRGTGSSVNASLRRD
jgi:hypothetical protein